MRRLISKYDFDGGTSTLDLQFEGRETECWHLIVLAASDPAVPCDGVVRPEEWARWRPVP